MSVVTQLYFQIVEDNYYVFRPFSGWAIIRFRLEYQSNLIYYNVDVRNNYVFRPFSGWAIIRLRLQYRRKLIYYNVDIKYNYVFRPFSGRAIIRLRLECRRNLIYIKTSRMGKRDLVLQCLGRCVAIYIYGMWNLLWLRLCLSCLLWVHRHVGWSRHWMLFWKALVGDDATKH
jgi:hypothetical protein